MPYKDESVRKLKHAEYSREHYLKNQAETKIRNAQTKRKKREEWVEFKSALSCTHCGFSHPAALDFHHIDRKDKQSVHKLAQNGNYKAAKEEIKKCITLCANCHRIVHYEEHKQKKKLLKKKKKKSNSSP
jgi:5-methylcytosine-specific restriction endonuclease McrA